MQKVKFIYMHGLYCCFFIMRLLNAGAQDSLTLKLGSIAITRNIPALDTGSRLPLLPEFKAINYTDRTIKLSDFKGKIIILHFWHQYCSYCVSAFAKLDSLQKAFKDRIVILPVTFQSEQSVKDFYSERKIKGKTINLPSIVEDTLLRKLFPHDGDPHEVWIDADGTVKAITEYRMITKNTLYKTLHNDDFNLPLRNHQFDFDPTKPFLIDNNGGPPNAFEYRSLLTPYNDSIDNNGLVKDADSSMTRLFLANATPLDLYKSLYTATDADFKNLELDYLNKHVIVETENKERFTYWPDEEKITMEQYQAFLHHHVFCYELILPAGYALNDAYEFMKEDLDRFFDCRAVKQERTVQCLALIRKDKNYTLQTKNENVLIQLSDDRHSIDIRNATINSLVALLNMYYHLPVVLNKTNYAGNTDINIDIENPDSINAINKALEKYGLELKPYKAKLSFLVITDRSVSK